MDDQISRSEEHQSRLPRTYEPPRIELVLTREEMDREAQYAGPASFIT